MLYTPDQLQSLSTLIEQPRFLVESIVPAKSKVILLHGPGGVGKSALLWSLANCLENGQPFLGMETQKARTLVISTDMSVYEVNLRWGEKFKANFHMEIISPFDILDKHFRTSEVFKRCSDYVKTAGIELVLIDTLGKIHFEDPSDAATVSRVYQALTLWFPETTIILNSHNKKSQRDFEGNEIITDDDFLGSRKWVDDAVVQLQMRKVNGSEFKSRLYNSKNQIAAKIAPIDLYIDLNGAVELWNDSRASKVIEQWKTVLKELDPIAAYVHSFSVSRATAYRVKNIFDSRHKVISST